MILITGGTSGIARHGAEDRRSGQREVAVIVCGRDQEKIDETLEAGQEARREDRRLFSGRR